MNIAEIRQKYPQYQNVDDDTLANALHKKYYADRISIDDFKAKIGLQQPQAMPTQKQFSDVQDPTAYQSETDDYKKRQTLASNQRASDSMERAVESVPILGGVKQAFDDAVTGGSQLLARGVDALTLGNTNLSKTFDKEAQRQERVYNEANPANASGYLNDVARLGGSVLTGGSGNIAGGALKKIAIGASVGSATSPVLQERGQEGNQTEFAKQKAIQLGVGGALGGSGVGANKLIGSISRPNTAIKTSSQVKNLARQAFQLADEQGAKIQPQETNLLINRLDSLGSKSDLGKALNTSGKAEFVQQTLNKFKDKNLSFKDVEELDKELTSIITDSYKEGRLSADGYKVQKIQDELRDWVDNLDFSGNDKQGLQTLKNARALYAQSMKLRDIESILQRSESMEQPATAIKVGFRQLLNNPKRLRGYTDKEKALIEKASKSGNVLDVVRSLGSRLNVITGIASGNPVRAGLSIAGSTASRGLGVKLQRNKALDVANEVASRNIDAPKNMNTILLDKQVQGLTETIKDIKTTKPINADYDINTQKTITPEEKLNIKDDQLKTYSGYSVNEVLNITRNKKTSDGSRFSNRPLTEALMETGIDPQGKVAKELAHMGITPKTTIGLFKKGGRKDLDNLDYSQYKHIGLEDDGLGYVDRDSILERLRQEHTESTPIKDKGRIDLEDDLMFLGLSKKPKKKELILKLKDAKVKELSDPTLGSAGQPMQDMPEEYFSSLIDNVNTLKSKINNDSGLSSDDKIKRLSNIRSALMRQKKDLIKNSNIPAKELEKSVNVINSAIVATQASRMTGQAMNAMNNKQNAQAQAQQPQTQKRTIDDIKRGFYEKNQVNTRRQEILNRLRTKPQASNETQYQFKRPEFVNKTVQAESSGNPNAKSKTSTASGLAGFTDGTWNEMQKKYGKQYGLNNKSDPMQQKIATDLLAQDNEKILKQKLKRNVTNKDLHVAHFMGAGGATRMILNIQRGQGDKLAYQTFRKEAKANKPIFFDGKRPRTIQEVYAVLASREKQ